MAPIVDLNDLVVGEIFTRQYWVKKNTTLTSMGRFTFMNLFHLNHPEPGKSY